MKKRRIMAVVLGLGLLGWALWPAASEPEPAEELPAVAALRQRLLDHQARQAARPPAPVLPPVAMEVPSLEEEEPVASEWGQLIVDVVDEDGRTDATARSWLVDCESQADGRGSYRAKGRCIVHAWRRDGALVARSQPVEIDVRPGETAYTSLELPSTRTGGLGVRIGWDGDAVVVQHVMPGTPAAEQGLETGDRIVEVDGISVRDLGLRGFIRTMTGPEGTDVHFVLSYEDEEGVIEEELAITRQFLES